MFIYDLWVTDKAQALLCPHSMLKHFHLTEKTGYNTRWIQECITENVRIYKKKECPFQIKGM